MFVNVKDVCVHANLSVTGVFTTLFLFECMGVISRTPNRFEYLLPFHLSHAFLHGFSKFFGHQLAFNQFLVGSIVRNKTVMGALLDYLALFHDHNFVRISNGRQSVSNYNNCLLARRNQRV